MAILRPSPSNPNPVEQEQPQYPLLPAHRPPQPKKNTVSQPHHQPPRNLSRTAYKLQVLHRLNERRPQEAKHSTEPKRKVRTFKWPSKRSALAGAVIVLILTVTGYVSFDTWQTNNLAKQAFVKDTSSTNSTTPSATDRQSSEGKDESPLAANTLANYRVASSLPRALYIDKLDVTARVLPMGVNNDGSMQAPLGIYDAGWYSGSVRPGETGAMVLNGHSSGPTRQALLANLDTLKQGDEIVIEKGDKSRLKYVVKYTETLPLEAVDMNKVMLPYGTAKRGLNIYTCTGTWLPAEQTFDHRVIVYAVEA